jgi:type I restriction enzyme S subunit
MKRPWQIGSIAELAGSGGLVTDGDWVESKDQDPDGEVRLIQLADIGDGVFLNRSHRFLTLEKARQLRCTFLQPGDMLIARMQDPLGRACIFPGVGQPAVTAVDVFVWRRDNTGADHGG